MSKHESAVNYANLIRDLADMYTLDVAEVVLVELIANSLDAGATQIKISFDQKKRILIVEDNGCGMSAENFEQYHDFAVGLKTRGTGIGFAGVGAKISFNIADRVRTETRSKSFSGGSNWYFQSKTKLVWEDFKATNIRSYGTRVEVSVRLFQQWNNLIPGTFPI
jgi:HSP90 family molecular chaperone